MKSRPHAIYAVSLALAASIIAGCVCVDGCARKNVAHNETAQVAVDVADIGFDRESATHYVLLREHSGSRTLPILIGDDEARAIMFEMRGLKPERPLTYELLRNAIEQTGNQVDRIVIGDMHNEIYYARIYLDHGRYILDSRPSDAIALAIGSHAPIFVADKLMQAAIPIAPGAGPSVKTAFAFGLTVQDLTPELARYFGVDPMSGVVVADMDPAAIQSGIQRGDIITNVEGHEIRNVDEFTHTSDSLGATPAAVSITVHRGNASQVVSLSPSTGAGSSAPK